MNTQDVPSSRSSLKLVIAVLIDLIGVMSYLIPSFGELFDAFWAPLSALLVFLLFGKKLSWASFTFIEELFPFTDLIPSATLAWYFRYGRAANVKNEGHLKP